MKRFQFTIRDLLLTIVIAGLAAGWWADHRRAERRLKAVEAQNAAAKAQIADDEADLKSEREAYREVVRNLNVPSAITSDSARNWEPGTPPPTPASSASARAALAPLIVEWGWKEPPPTFAASESGVRNYDADERLLYDQRSKITPFVAK